MAVVLVTKLKEKTVRKDASGICLKAYQAACETKYGFIHIPKTGGSSVISTVNRIAESVAQIGSPYDLANFPEIFDNTRILAGHIPLFMFKWERHNREFATVLRDPVQRVISAYRYILATPGHYAHRYFQHLRPSLAECFDHPVLRIEFENFQTKMLGFDPASAITWPAHGQRKSRIFFKAYSDFFY